ncbi:hypothetical protein BGZ88_003261, partial [Linnemannia elongata]
MSSSSPQGNLSSLPYAPSSAPPRYPAIFADGQRVPSQFEDSPTLGGLLSKSGEVLTIAQGLATMEPGPANLLSPLGHRTIRDVAADVDYGPGEVSYLRSASSSRSSKFGFTERLVRLFKGDKKVKEPAPASTAPSAPVMLVGTRRCIQSVARNCNAVNISLIQHSSLLAQIQEISKLEYDLHALRQMRIAEYKQAVYIDPMAKLSLQDTDDDMFPLMDKVRDFLANDTQ